MRTPATTTLVGRHTFAINGFLKSRKNLRRAASRYRATMPPMDCVYVRFGPKADMGKVQTGMSALPPKVDMDQRDWNVR